MAIPRGSNIRNRTMTRPNERGFRAVARFMEDGKNSAACSESVSTPRSRNFMAAGPQKEPLSVPSPPTMAIAS